MKQEKEARKARTWEERRRLGTEKAVQYALVDEPSRERRRRTKNQVAKEQIHILTSSSILSVLAKFGDVFCYVIFNNAFQISVTVLLALRSGIQTVTWKKLLFPQLLSWGILCHLKTGKRMSTRIPHLIPVLSFKRKFTFLLCTFGGPCLNPLL